MRFMGRLRQCGVIIAAGAILTGCTVNIGGGGSGETSDAEQISNDAVPSSNAPSEDTDLATSGTANAADPVIPPLGKFDRNSPKYDQFNPCTEIPDSFLTSVGLLEKRISANSTDSDGICSFEIDSKYGDALLSLAGNDWGFDQYRYLSGETRWSETEQGRAILISRDDWFGGIGCSAVVETERGTFDVMFQSDPNEETYDSCREAEQWLDLILEVDGKNGT